VREKGTHNPQLPLTSKSCAHDFLNVMVVIVA